MMWARENDFDPAFDAAAEETGVERALLKAITGAESGFDPNAIRSEAASTSLPPTPDFPAGGDASFGLMQVLSRTARALGFEGTLNGLLVPATNIDLGARLLRSLFDNPVPVTISDVISAYNGGIRPSLGYGRPLASGHYANQAYVDRVLGALDYFRGQEVPGGEPGSFPDDQAGWQLGTGAIVLLIVVSLMSSYARRRR